PLHAAQRHRDYGAHGVGGVRVCRDLPAPRTGPAARWIDRDLQRADAPCAGTFRGLGGNQTDCFLSNAERPLSRLGPPTARVGIVPCGSIKAPDRRVGFAYCTMPSRNSQPASVSEAASLRFSSSVVLVLVVGHW